MNFLVTGGSGFIGNNLVLKLSKKKNSKIYIIDYVKPSLKIKNVIYIKGNLKNFNVFNKINSKIDYIYHLAADLGVQKVIDNPIGSLSNNLLSTENIIKFAKKKKVKRVFFFSTSEVYSILNKRGKMEEDDSLVLPSINHPRTSYWLSKIYGEFLVIMSGLPYTVFRIFNMYGPNMKITHVIPSIFFGLKNKKTPVFQNPNHSRCFLFVDDGIKLILEALKPKYKNNIINIANPSEEIKIKNLVNKIQNILNIKKKVTFKNINNQSIIRRRPSINKILKLKKTKFKFTKLDQGLLLLKKYYEGKNF